METSAKRCNECGQTVPCTCMLKNPPIQDAPTTKRIISVVFTLEDGSVRIVHPNDVEKWIKHNKSLAVGAHNNLAGNPFDTDPVELIDIKRTK